jgi:hypothetical protein
MNINENSSIRAFSLPLEALLAIMATPIEKALDFIFDKGILGRLQYFRCEIYSCMKHRV